MTATVTGAVLGPDGMLRCPWAGTPGVLMSYHDLEWGTPVDGERGLFERMALEGFQAGLSWLTVLNKRERFREVFCDFAVDEVALYGEAEVAQLLQDPGIIRHRGKIEAAIANARATLAVQADRGSLAALVWEYEPARRGRAVPVLLGDLPTQTAESVALSKALRRYGFRFVGPTTAYAAMESLGLVNDHLKGCHVRAACEQQRRQIILR